MKKNEQKKEKLNTLFSLSLFSGSPTFFQFLFLYFLSSDDGRPRRGVQGRARAAQLAVCEVKAGGTFCDCPAVDRSIFAIAHPLRHLLPNASLLPPTNQPTAGSHSSRRRLPTRCGPRGRAPIANTPRGSRKNLATCSLQAATAAKAKVTSSPRPKRQSRQRLLLLMLPLLPLPPLPSEEEASLAVSEEERQQQGRRRPSTLAPLPPLLLLLRRPHLSLAPLLPRLPEEERACSAPLPRGLSTLAVVLQQQRQEALASAAPAVQWQQRRQMPTTVKQKKRKKRQRLSSTEAPPSSSRRRPSSTPRALTKSGWTAAREC